jgi:molybdopterin synthase catalytic subunit
MGAMAGPSLLRITADRLDPREALEFVADDAAGGTCLFLGTVRDHSGDEAVTGLRYEAWEELAARRLGEIAEDMFERWPLRKVALLHRTGDLRVGEISVIVTCSAGHRAEAFEACRHGIERLKEDAPIWKKEALSTGRSQWVAGS